MVTTGVSSLFVDTNILVQASVAQAPLYQQARTTIAGYEQAGTQIWVSRQILREFLAVLSRPQSFSNPQTPATLITEVQFFQSRFHLAEDNQQVTDQLLNLLSQFSVGGRQIHDANIVATMLVQGVSHLLTNNVADFSRFASLITVIPL